MMINLSVKNVITNANVLQKVLLLKLQNALMNTLKNEIHGKYIFRGMFLSFVFELLTGIEHTMQI